MYMAPRWLMPMPWPKRRAVTMKRPFSWVTDHSSLEPEVRFMESALSSSLKISKLSVPLPVWPFRAYTTSKDSLVYKRLGAAYLGVWAYTPVTAAIDAPAPNWALAFRFSSVPTRLSLCAPEALTEKDSFRESGFAKS